MAEHVQSFRGHGRVYKAKHLLRAIRCKSALVPRLRALRFYPRSLGSCVHEALALIRTNKLKMFFKRSKLLISPL